jgi:hypothetical protein
MSGTAGARVPLGENLYIGGHYRFQWISSTSDSLFDYDNITIHGLSGIIGANF